jgi:hypothetical protein
VPAPAALVPSQTRVSRSEVAPSNCRLRFEDDQGQQDSSKLFGGSANAIWTQHTSLCVVAVRWYDFRRSRLSSAIVRLRFSIQLSQLICHWRRGADMPAGAGGCRTLQCILITARLVTRRVALPQCASSSGFRRRSQRLSGPNGYPAGSRFPPCHACDRTVANRRCCIAHSGQSGSSTSALHATKLNSQPMGFADRSASCWTQRVARLALCPHGHAYRLCRYAKSLDHYPSGNRAGDLFDRLGPELGCVLLASVVPLSKAPNQVSETGDILL